MSEPSSRSSRGAFRKGRNAQAILTAAKRATTTKTTTAEQDRGAEQDRVAEAEERQRKETEKKLGKEKIAEILDLKKKQLKKF